MSTFALDTNIISNLLRNDPAISARLQHENDDAYKKDPRSFFVDHRPGVDRRLRAAGNPGQSYLDRRGCNQHRTHGARDRIVRGR